MSTSVRTSSCSIEAGLYTIRYASSDEAVAPPATIELRSGDIRLIPAPGRRGGELTQPGQCVAILAASAGVIDIVVDGGGRAVAPNASFSIDLLDRGNPSATADQRGERTDGRSRQPDRDPTLTVEAHVSRLGDVKVLAGEWVAGPDRPLPIEGLTVSIGGGDLGIEVQTRSERGSGEWSAWVSPGQFAGTRQRAEALNGLRLRLSGRDADENQIAVEALFLGSSVVRKVGRMVEVSGYDPLVGLKLDVVRGGVIAQENMVASNSQVKIFKARGRG